MSARTTALRATLAERDARLRALPKAWCRVCGGWAHAGEGAIDVPATDSPDPDRFPTYDAWLRAQPSAAHGWRRTCAACAASEVGGYPFSHAVAGVLGIPRSDVREADAHALFTEMGRVERRPFVHPGEIDVMWVPGFPSAAIARKATGTPWGHVTDAERDRAWEVYRAQVADRSERPSAWGGCGMCGRAKAVGDWWQAPSALTWPDGGRVAFCEPCAAVWRLRGEPTDIDDLRRVGVEAATSWAVPLGVSAPASFRLFAESRAADPVGLPEPWAWSDALTEYIERLWTERPVLAPEHRREEFRTRHEAAERIHAEQIRQAREEEAVAAW